LSRNGSGNYQPPASSFPAVSGTLIESAKFNNTINDIASALTQSISNDGQTPILANIPMGGFKLTGLAAGVASGQSVEFGQLAAYAPLASPVLTGNPTAPTPLTADNDTSIATTAFVKAQAYAPLASPALTGNPTAPTATPGDNDTTIATTAFVTAAAAGFAPLASPTFTGVPAAPTAADGTSTTQLATTAFVCDGWFESAEQTITTNSLASVSHGLGRVPQDAQVVIRCKTAEFSYSIGDEVTFNTSNGADYVAPNLFVNSTTIGMAVRTLTIIPKDTTSSHANITVGNWRIVFRCR